MQSERIDGPADTGSNHRHRNEAAAGNDHRHRLLEAMARACASQGFAATTIADLVADAHVSKRTFYEFFESKAACFLALYESASANGLDVLRAHLDTPNDWQEALSAAMSAYFQALSSEPVLLRCLFVEVLGLGSAGLAARRRVTNQIARFIVTVVEHQSRAGTRYQIEEADAIAMVGGIYELILREIEQGRADRLKLLTEPATRFVRALVDASARRPG